MGFWDWLTGDDEEEKQSKTKPTGSAGGLNFISRDILDEDEEEEEEGGDELNPKWDSSSFFKRHALDHVTLEEKDGKKEIVYVDPPNNWVVVDRMIDDISKRHDMDKPSSVLYTPTIDSSLYGGKVNYGKNQVKLPAQSYTNAPYGHEDQYQTLYHEMRHLNQPVTERAVDSFYETITDDVGPYHEQIHKDSMNMPLPKKRWWD